MVAERQAGGAACPDAQTPVLEGRGLARAFLVHGGEHAARADAKGLRRHALRAVDGVSFSLAAGRTLGVVGASGSGKSTLGELAGGLRRPTAGSVWFRGHDVATLDRAGRAAFRRGVQFVFQDPVASMNPSFTVARVLADPLRVMERGLSRAEARRRVEAMLERVGLPASVLDAYPRELSGGQCQRVAIARALLLGPQVVVCDECTSALDVSVQAQILNLLRDLQDDLGTAYLFISHDMGVVGYMADDVLVMQEGRAVEEGPAARVMGAPQAAYTRDLLAAAYDDVLCAPVPTSLGDAQ